MKWPAQPVPKPYRKVKAILFVIIKANRNEGGNKMTYEDRMAEAERLLPEVIDLYNKVKGGINHGF